MFKRIADLSEQATETATDAAWLQWACLRGSTTSLPVDLLSMVDLEALLIASLALRQRETRLRDEIAWWIPLGSRLISIPRFKALRRRIPAALDTGHSWLAQLAVAEGDPRWKGMLTADMPDEPYRPDKGPIQLQLIACGSEWVRLRAGFGVGAKADVLAFLLGASNHPQGQAGMRIKQIAAATSYSVASVRRACNDMVLARMVQSESGRSPALSVRASDWDAILSTANQRSAAGERYPRWGQWDQAYRFLFSIHRWCCSAPVESQSVTVAASTARDLYLEFQPYLRWAGWESIDHAVYQGDSFLEPFLAWAEGTVVRIGRAT